MRDNELISAALPIPLQLKRKVEDISCYDAAVERVKETYKLFDNILVSSSCGKDSTAILNVTLEAARQLGRLPVDVVFWDEEVLQPETVEYAYRLAQRDDISFHWYCLPVQQLNACSKEFPFWYCWALEDQELWTRELPRKVSSSMELILPQEWPNFPRNPIIHSQYVMRRNHKGTTALLLGTRASESMRRSRSVLRRELDNYISWYPYDRIATVKPIYDWYTHDVWTAITKGNWDYNKTYDIYTQMGIPHDTQRIAPPYAEQPLQRMYVWSQAWPEVWSKMVYRVPGAATAARYSRSELYSANMGEMTKPDEWTWKDMIEYYLEMYPDNLRALISSRIKQDINLHYRKTFRMLPEDIPDPISGTCWKLLTKIAHRGDFKRRTENKVKGKAIPGFLQSLENKKQYLRESILRDTL
jgi:predicted phosphoadenosine phosphosulfate sulfurtransferase